MTDPVDYRMPEPCTGREWLYDQIEPRPLNPYIAAAEQMLAFLNRSAVFILESRSKDIATWGVAYALGLDVALRQPMAAVARKIIRPDGEPISRAAISKETKEFQRGCNLPPSLAQKGANACLVYYAKRLSQLE